MPATHASGIAAPVRLPQGDRTPAMAISRRQFLGRSGVVLGTPGLLLAATAGAASPDTNAPTSATVLAAAAPSDWRRPDPENLLVLALERPAAWVVVELAPRFAPGHVANVKALAREGYFDGLAITRVQDNYVVQWGDPDAEDKAKARPVRKASRHLPAELDFPLPDAAGFTRVPDGDLYAPEAGFLDGFPVARDPDTGRAWPVHAYGMLGAGRDNALDSGGGTELYVVIGQAPRHLDRNCTLFGRVVQGIEHLSSLPRGTGPMGFYEKPAERVPIRSLRVAADLPEGERPKVELFRTDTPRFRQWIETRRNRREPWFHRAAGRIDVANIPLPSR